MPAFGVYPTITLPPVALSGEEIEKLMSVKPDDHVDSILGKLRKRAEHLRTELKKHNEMVKELQRIENILILED